MKVGIDLRLHAYAPGGISRYARRLARALTDLIPPDQLTLLLHRKEREALAIPGVRSRRLLTPPHHPFERWLLGAEVWPLGLDVLHSTDFIPPAWGARRRVVTVHDLNFLHYPDYLTAEARRYYNEQIEWAVTRADVIIVDSYATQRDLTQLLGVAPERVTVAHLAADERFRRLPRSEVEPILGRHGLAPGYLLFVGVWEPRKNLGGLFEALKILQERGEARPLVVAGRPGWLDEEIYAAVRDLRLGARIRFVERPSVDELVALYNGALLLVLPSFYEGFGLPALEAMQCGTPTVVSNRASLPEVVGDAGLLVDPDDPASIADACWRLITDPDERARLRERGDQQARAFTWRATAEKTVQAYRAALKR